ncbi:N-acetylmuramoyl-L-alanine amidase [Methanobrevibacter sp.]|uniref:N-acetylmuramoyl-L-alanine amidase n=1 Tax=Methanobrevibacter sp. TaxID=66852 RepID=UPI00388F5B05
MKITVKELPKNKYDIKCPYTMTPKGITYHETYNDAPAENEIAYMQRNDNQVSFHYAVDDLGAIQGCPLDRNTWHAGDGGNGEGNRTTISIECCYSKSGGAKYDKAFDNSLTLIAQLLKENGWTTKQVYYHKNWSGKQCPNRALANGITLTKFKKLVQARYDELYAPKKSIDEIAKEVIAGKWGNGTERKNALTKAGYDYAKVQAKVNELLAKPKATSKPKTIEEGSKVKIKNGAKYGGLSTARGRAVPLAVRNKKHTVAEFGTHKGIKEARLKEINSWVAVASLTLV